MGKPQPLVSEVQHLIPTALYEDRLKLCNDSQITMLLWLWVIVHTGNSLTWFMFNSCRYNKPVLGIILGSGFT